MENKNEEEKHIQSEDKTKQTDGKTAARPDPSANIVDGKFRCGFYLQKKKRFCRCLPANGLEYCVEHSYVLQGDKIERKRVVCPFDPKHTCYEDQLKKHLKKCNAKMADAPAYFKHNLNGGDQVEEDVVEKLSVKSIPMEDLQLFIEKVQKLYKEHCPEIVEEIYFHDVLQEESQTPGYGAPALKHIKQQASLLGHMEKCGLLKADTCFIEFGSGKGQLSHWVQKALAGCNNVNFILVDKGAVRYKLDSYHRSESQGPSFERLRMDIQHLDLSRVPSVDQQGRSVVAMSKHLCGAATDLTLRCLTNFISQKSLNDVPNNESQGNNVSQNKEDVKSEPDNEPESECNSITNCDNATHVVKKQKPNDPCTKQMDKRWVNGVVIALCCHHQCGWDSYVGKQFMCDNDISASDFHLLTTLTSWRTCGSRPSAEQIQKHNADQYNHDKYGSLTPEEREEIGRQGKLLIDIGRMKYFQAQGFDVTLKAYTSTDISLENYVLIAVPKTSINGEI